MHRGWGKGSTGGDDEGPPDSRDEEITMVDSMVWLTAVKKIHPAVVMSHRFSNCIRRRGSLFVLFAYSLEKALVLTDSRSTAFAAPELPEELALCTVLEEILGVTQVGIHDDFFALGGHSLAAMQMAQRTAYSLADIMAHPSISSLLKSESVRSSIPHVPDSDRISSTLFSEFLKSRCSFRTLLIS